MPEEPIVWIVLILGISFVIGLALWLGRGLNFHRKKNSISLELKEQVKQNANLNIRVANNVELADVFIEDISGIKSEDTGTVIDSGKNIDVLHGGKITKAKIGDITGIKQKRTRT